MDGITTLARTAKIRAADVRSLRPRLELPHATSRAESDGNRRHYHVVRAVTPSTSPGSSGAPCGPRLPSGPGSTTTSPGASRLPGRAAVASTSFTSRLMKNASLGNRERAGVGIEATLDADSE